MKKIMSVVLVLTIVLLAGAMSAFADRGGYGGHGWRGGGGVGIGVTVGPGLWWPGWWNSYPYYYPYAPYYPYYPQPPAVVESTPDLYVQPAPKANETRYLYFCPDPQGYYPDINRCPRGWLKVVPQANPPEGEE